MKKKVRKAGRKTKEAVDAVTAEAKRAARKASLDVIIESPLGGTFIQVRLFLLFLVHFLSFRDKIRP